MSEVQAPRMRRPSWRDPRLGVGVLLVVGSVALGAWVVAGADATVEVYQARVPLTPGEPVSTDDLEVVQVRLDDVAAVYAVPGAAELADGVITRTVPAGELVPLSAIGTLADVDVRPVQVPMSAALADVVAPGSRVDLWVARPDPASPQGALLEPEPLVEGVEVRDVVEDASVFAATDELQVQVLVRDGDLAEVLAAVASEAQVLVVPFGDEVG